MDYLFAYYGIDWAAMILGFFGAWLISNKDRRGFYANAGACCFGFLVALLSGQWGFVVSNAILCGLSVRGWLRWKSAEGTQAENHA